MSTALPPRARGRTAAAPRAPLAATKDDPAPKPTRDDPPKETKTKPGKKKYDEKDWCSGNHSKDHHTQWYKNLEAGESRGIKYACEKCPTCKQDHLVGKDLPCPDTIAAQAGWKGKDGNEGNSGADSADGADSASATYTTGVQAIFQQYCAGCGFFHCGA